MPTRINVKILQKQVYLPLWAFLLIMNTPTFQQLKVPIVAPANEIVAICQLWILSTMNWRLMLTMTLTLQSYKQASNHVDRLASVRSQSKDRQCRHTIIHCHRFLYMFQESNNLFYLKKKTIRLTTLLIRIFTFTLKKYSCSHTRYDHQEYR